MSSNRIQSTQNQKQNNKQEPKSKHKSEADDGRQAVITHFTVHQHSGSIGLLALEIGSPRCAMAWYGLGFCRPAEPAGRLAQTTPEPERLGPAVES